MLRRRHTLIRSESSPSILYYSHNALWIHILLVYYTFMGSMHRIDMIESINVCVRVCAAPILLIFWLSFFSSPSLSHVLSHVYCTWTHTYTHTPHRQPSSHQSQIYVPRESESGTHMRLSFSILSIRRRSLLAHLCLYACTLPACVCQPLSLSNIWLILFTCCWSVCHRIHTILVSSHLPRIMIKRLYIQS